MRLHGALVAVLAAMVGALGSVPAGAQDTTRPIGPGVVNLAHLDSLHDSVPYPAVPPAGHSTTDPGTPIDTWWVYANFDAATGTYKRTGGGAYDAATNTYGQGAFDTDDVARAAVAYLTHYRFYHDRHSLDMARGALRFVLYMETTSKPNAGNFVLWMQPGGALNLTPTPPDSPNPADSGASYWMARSIWALGEGYQTFRKIDPGFAATIASRLDLALGKLEAELVGPKFGTYYKLHGYQTPAWLIADGADASSEAMLGLTPYFAATGNELARRLDSQLGAGIAGFQLGTSRDWPWQALMPWARSVSDWHAWGAHMSMALAGAGVALDRPSWVAAATRDASSFETHQQLSFGAINGLLPAPDDLSQIAYGNETTVDGLLGVGVATGNDVFRRWAGIAGSWLFGDNPAGTPMYQPATGVVFDGVNGDGTLNRNSGAESTIEGLISLMNAVNDPVARHYLGYLRIAGSTYQKVEAEAGRLYGAATVVTPASAWTGEAQWSNGKYVDLGPGGSDAVSVGVPSTGRYLVYVVFDKQPGESAATAVRLSVDGVSVGTDNEGGAGEQGVSPNPDYLWIDSLALPEPLVAGAHTITLTYMGTGAVHAKVDALLVQPEVESKLLEDGTQRLALYKSLAAEPAPLQLPPGRRWQVRVYDRNGELTESEDRDDAGHRIPPYGFAIASSR
ncbi:MAG: hypothetical protein M3024_15435 [Candidatus Dormibacteraeota bacterium]|nr:hypothetical protein [Candidatus Dormibacteraeota bacterium]